MNIKIRNLLTTILLFSSASADSNPVPGSFRVCTNYHCSQSQNVILPATDWQTVRALFVNTPSAKVERERIKQAIALLEKQVGQLTGTAGDLAGNRAGAGLPGQLDCISESTNTTTYLRLLANNGLLNWHKISPRRVRHLWIFNTHWTAVITDHSEGVQYAVDAWYLDNGQPPYIQRIEDWLQGKNFIVQ